MKKAPAFMSLEELDQELMLLGWYRRERTTIDEHFPRATWVLIGPHGEKQGASNCLEVATNVLRIRREASEKATA